MKEQVAQEERSVLTQTQVITKQILDSSPRLREQIITAAPPARMSDAAPRSGSLPHTSPSPLNLQASPTLGISFSGKSSPAKAFSLDFESELGLQAPLPLRRTNVSPGPETPRKRDTANPKTSRAGPLYELDEDEDDLLGKGVTGLGGLDFPGDGGEDPFSFLQTPTSKRTKAYTSNIDDLF